MYNMQIHDAHLLGESHWKVLSKHDLSDAGVQRGRNFAVGTPCVF